MHGGKAISKYQTDDFARKTAEAQWPSVAPEWANRIRWAIDGDDCFVDCFGVVAVDQDAEGIGRLNCIRNERDRRRMVVTPVKALLQA